MLTAPTSDIKVGMAYDVGGRGDQSFNDSAAAGLDQAVEEFGMRAPRSPRPRTARPSRLARSACAPSPTPASTRSSRSGFAYAASLTKVAEEYPDVHFAIIDDASLPTADNVANLVFAEEQGSFLVGAAAALKSEADHIGFIGGVETPADPEVRGGLHRRAPRPSTRTSRSTSTYLTQAPDFSGFGDPAKGKTAAQGMYDGGADIVYHAAGGSGGGVFEAAAEARGTWRSVSTPTSTTPPTRR